MADRSILNNFQTNDTPYVAFQDNNDQDLEEETSESFVLRQTGIPRTISSRSSTFQNFVNRQQRYQHLPEDDIDEEPYQESNEVPRSLIIEMPSQRKKLNPRPGMNIKEMTMWKWANVENLDIFFEQQIQNQRTFSLRTLGFVMGFSTFLVGCVDYSLMREKNRLSEVIIPQCISKLSGWTKLFLVLFSIFWIIQVVRFVSDIRRLIDMYNFYTYLLDIPDVDMQTVSWQQIVNQIIKIRDNNPTTSQGSANKPQQRLDAHNITNRIMRQENYLIALFNKDVLNLTIPIPFFKKRNMLTKTLEWNLSFCVQNYVFNDHGQVRKRFIKDVQRTKLIQGLRRRFIFMGLLNFIFAPFIVIYLILYFFFRYFEEFRSNPGTLGSRHWSPFARWKFREFNELPHLFYQRLSKSYKPANKYIDQFPKEKTKLITQFILFIVGSFAAILIVVTYIDPTFEITSGRTVFFYTGVFVPILAVSRGTIPDDHLVFDPETRLKKVVEHTHYSPNEWKGRLHSDEVRREFNQLFEVKSYPDSFFQIIDFFREFTVHVDGIGHVCSFAVFDFKRHGNVKYGAPAEVDNEYYLSKDGKMEKSFLNFKANHPDWEPTDPAGSLYLSRLTEFNNQIHPERPSTTRTSAMDSIVKSNRRGSNVHFGYPIGASQSTTHLNSVTVGGVGMDSIIEDEPSTSNKSHRSYQADRLSVEPPGSPSSSQEYYASDLGDSYLFANTKNRDGVSESVEHDRPRNGGLLGLMNQFYELNNSAM
ncbi:16685_t:CDS:10 [Acaulospora morrowiae]|uniref:Autophagy-related protein 9 n=1 Tax=Acaulospora morrowiae TaxID=94023 RepID=A0A9N8WKI1_9GLOM|nr:16685_t:CDS:10 [Acaulospora morrowiae]